MIFKNLINNLKNQQLITSIKSNNLKNLKNLIKDRKYVDMFVYNEGFNLNKENNNIVLKQDNVLCYDIWLKKGSSTYDKKQYESLILKKEKNSDSYYSNYYELNTLFIKTIPKNIMYIKSNNNKGSDLIFKKIKEIENSNNSGNSNNDNDNLKVHFFTENDYFKNELYKYGNNENNNIFYINSNNNKKINEKCSECLSGNLKELKLPDKKEDDEILTFYDNNSRNYYNYNNNKKEESSNNKTIKINKNELVKCSECEIILNKNINQIINLQRNAESYMVKNGKTPTYLTNYLYSIYIFEFIWNLLLKLFYLIINLIYMILYILSKIFPKM